jgi:hypothetical protein
MKPNEPNEQRPGKADGRSRAIPRPLAMTLIAVPVVATAGAFGIPALAATSGHDAGTRLTSTAAVADHPGSTQDAVRQAAQAAAARARAAALAKAEKQAKTAKQAKTEVSEEAALAAFFGHGHDYDDAVRLAKLWHIGTTGGDLSAVKAAAGRNILAGRPLTATPRGLPSPQAALRAFYRAGYDYDDAVLLARIWGVSPAQAKAQAGRTLLIGQQPPVRPGQTAATVSDDAALAAYFASGYDYQDAVRLAAIWHQGKDGDDLTSTKTAAGRKLLAGITLPVRP